MSAIRLQRGTLPCGCVIGYGGIPLHLCSEAKARRARFHAAMCDWCGTHPGDLRVAQTGDEYYEHLQQENEQ